MLARRTGAKVEDGLAFLGGGNCLEARQKSSSLKLTVSSEENGCDYEPKSRKEAAL